MKQIKTIFLVSILAGFIACNNQTQNEEADLAVPVSVEDVKLQAILQFINTTGTAKSKYEVDLSSEMTGIYHVAKNPATGKPFKLGDQVKKGQTIIEFEDAEYENGIAIESKKLNLEISVQNYDKQKSLYEKGGVTLYDLRNSEVSKTNAEYDFANAELQLAKMKVVAPFDGVIVAFPYYTEGTRVTSGQAMVSLMSYKTMYMEFNLPEKNISDIKLGQKVFINNYTIAEDTLIGTVSEISPAISTETRTFNGKIQINNPELKLRPGMFVKADIITAQKDSAVVIPKDLIISGNRGKYVFIVERTAARERRIRTGIENQENIEIIEGLKANDRLVVKGFETLRNGSKVKVIR